MMNIKELKARKKHLNNLIKVYQDPYNTNFPHNKYKVKGFKLEIKTINQRILLKEYDL